MSPVVVPPHPVTGLLERLGEHVEALRDAWLLGLSPEETRRALRESDALLSRLVELQTRLVSHADRVEIDGSGTRPWLARHTRQTRASTLRLTRLAAALDRELHAPVRRALAAALLNPDQALAIVDAVDALPDEADDATRARAQEIVVHEAAHLDAAALRVLGRRVFELVAPDQAEAHEQRLLEAEEARAAASARLTMSDDGHGTTHGRFQIPSRHGEALRKMLTAIAAPKAQRAVHGAGGWSAKPGPQRLGHALCELIDRVPVDVLPEAGGVNATVVVTISEEALRSGAGVGRLDTGQRVSVGAVRRLACEAGILPMVLGGRSEPLDLGRRRRFHTRHQRLAIAARDQACTAEGCDVAAWLCHVHHDRPWSRGGPTSVRDGRLLCPRHHARAHDPAFDLTRLADGSVRFHRRT